MVANLMAAVGSPETGVVILSDWVKSHEVAEAKSVGGQFNGASSAADKTFVSWQIVRGSIEAALLAKSHFGDRLSRIGLLAMQQKITQRLGSLLGIRLDIGTGASFGQFCRRTNESNNKWLKFLGQKLAFQFATERALLVELWDPNSGHTLSGDLRPRADDPFPDLKKIQINNLLEESSAVTQNARECFGLVSEYDREPGKWNAYFQANMAQLRLINTAYFRKKDRGDPEYQIIDDIISDAMKSFDAPRPGYTPPGDNIIDSYMYQDSWERTGRRLRQLQNWVAQLK